MKGILLAGGSGTRRRSSAAIRSSARERHCIAPWAMTSVGRPLIRQAPAMPPHVSGPPAGAPGQPPISRDAPQRPKALTAIVGIVLALIAVGVVVAVMVTVELADVNVALLPMISDPPIE
jgi:hypothetical protein